LRPGAGVPAPCHRCTRTGACFSKTGPRVSPDFVHDSAGDGTRFRMLNMVDDVPRECLRAAPDTSISGRRVAREVTDFIAKQGKPGMIVSDNDTEPTSNAVLARCGEIGSSGVTSRRASRCRTATSRASTAAWATSCPTRRYFSA
jgi:transposase InsO family protein